MKKETAVEWLRNQYRKYDALISTDFEQAKQMEKEQIMQDYSVGYSNGQVDSNRTAEQYYNETYGNENS